MGWQVAGPAALKPRAINERVPSRKVAPSRLGVSGAATAVVKVGVGAGGSKADTTRLCAMMRAGQAARSRGGGCRRLTVKKVWDDLHFHELLTLWVHETNLHLQLKNLRCYQGFIYESFS